MAMALPLTAARGPGRPRLAPAVPCPLHPGSVTHLDGSRLDWSPFYEKRKWRCWPSGRAKTGSSHTFLETLEQRRHPTDEFPDFHGACVTCGSEYTLDDGPASGMHSTLVSSEAAHCLARIGEGVSLRRSAQDTRAQAHREMFETDVWLIDSAGRRRLSNAGPGRGRIEDEYSREANLASYYLDSFAPAIIRRLLPRAWPKAITLDSLPLKQRRFSPDEGRVVTDDVGEILAIADATSRPGEAMGLWIGGGRNAEEWIEFFSRPEFDQSTGPEWVVADDDNGIARAIRTRWPKAVFYRCEGHLIRNARDAFERDGLPEWVLKSAIEDADDATAAGAAPASVAGVPPPPDTGARRRSKRDPQAKMPKPRDYAPNPVLVAIDAMVWNVKHWEQLKAVVERWVPKDRNHLRAWVRANEPLMLRQYALKQAHPGMPRSNGAAEGMIDFVKKKLAGRAVRFGNARRMQAVLDLMALYLAHRADERLYTAIIRDFTRAQPKHNSGVTAEDRNLRMYDKGAGSIALRVERSALAAAAHVAGVRSAISRAFVTSNQAAQAAQRQAQGLPPAQTRKARLPGTLPQTGGVQSRAGKKVSDFPCAEEWDYDANAGLDPTAIPAWSTDPVWWRCDAHMGDADPHPHLWKATPHARTAYNSGCPFCMGRRVCPSNCLAAIFPDSLLDWDWEANGDRTPYTVAPYTRDKAVWRCLRDPSHPPYPQAVDAHTGGFQRCPLHRAEKTAKLKATLAKQREGIRQETEAFNARAAEAQPDAPAVQPAEATDQDGEIGIDPEFTPTLEDEAYNANFEAMLEEEGWGKPPPGSVLLTREQLDEEGF